MLKIVALLLALFSGLLIAAIIAALLAIVGLALPVPVVMLLLLAAAFASRWWLLRDSPSMERLIYQGCTVGIIEWLFVMIAFQAHVASDSSVLRSSNLAFLSVLIHPVTSFQGLCFCLVGRRLMRRRAQPKVDAGAAKTPPATKRTEPNRTKTVVLIGIQVAAFAAVLVFLAWVESGHGWEGLLVLLMVSPLVGAFLATSVACLVQGIRHMRGVHHRGLGVLAVAVSSVPIFITILSVVGARVDAWRSDRAEQNDPAPRWAWVEMREDVEPAAERSKQYRRIAQALQHPQHLQYAYVESDEAILVLADSDLGADSVEVHLAVPDADGLATFCNESLIGQPVVVQIPEEGAFWRQDATVLYQGERIDQYRLRLVRTAAYEQGR
jgi:hypothetical protein